MVGNKCWSGWRKILWKLRDWKKPWMKWAQKRARERDWGTERGEREGVRVHSMHTTRPTATRGTSVPITRGASLTWSELAQEVETFQKGRRGKPNGIKKLYLSVPHCWIDSQTDRHRREWEVQWSNSHTCHLFLLSFLLLKHLCMSTCIPLLTRTHLFCFSFLCSSGLSPSPQALLPLWVNAS